MYHLIHAGTYSTQPAVTTQTFGHKYGGFIYAFLFSCDIINNFLVATLSTVGHWSLQLVLGTKVRHLTFCCRKSRRHTAGWDCS